MFLETLTAARDLGRLHEIASILIRFGFSDLVRRLGISHALERAGRVLHWRESENRVDMDLPERVCKALEDLGPTFIKLGQILSARVDLFSPEWIRAFEKLQDDVPSLPFEKIKEQIEKDLGQSLDEIFSHVDVEAFAAASIAQVHRASLKDGAEVILKVRRPGIEKKVEPDLRLLARLAEISESNMSELKRYHPIEIVRQFSLSLRREMDLAGECRFSERIAKNLKADRNIIIPKVYWEWTSERLNVQQFIDGVRGRYVDKLEQYGIDRKLIAKRGAHAVLKMVLVDGLFHADPHLGNLICLPGNKVAFIDFGMVGRISKKRREQIIDLLYALVKKDAQGVVTVLDDWVAEGRIDEDVLVIEIETFLDHYHGLNLKDLDFSAMLTDLISILREHELSLPADLALLFKTFLTLDGVGRRLDPDFNIVEEANPFLSDLIKQRYSPQELWKTGFGNAQELVSALSSLPSETQALVKMLRRRGMRLNVDMGRLDHFGGMLSHAVNRLTLGIVIAALIIGSAIVSLNEQENTLLGLPIWGMVGFLASALGGVLLLISIWRSGK